MQKKYIVLIVCYFSISSLSLHAQQSLSLPKAISTAIEHFGTIQAKTAYAAASRLNVAASVRDNLPNLNLGAQQVFGTVNGQTGPLMGLGGLSVASGGPTLSRQNNNAAFGALYLTNVNWDFFAFGKAKEKIKTAKAIASRDDKDLTQEIFQHKIRVTAAYLNLLAAQQLTRVYRHNLERADTLRHTVRVRVLNGLMPGVDSTQANAEYSSSKIILDKAKTTEADYASQLAQLMGVAMHDWLLDTMFVRSIPAVLQDTIGKPQHPILNFYQSRIDLNQQQNKFLKTSGYPVMSVLGILQGRASGFNSGYGSNQNDFSTGYWDGIYPSRTNYLLGVGVTWNLTQPYRITQQLKAQALVTRGLQDELNMIQQQLQVQLALSNDKIKYALDIDHEAPAQLKAAAEAYLQKSVLYRNGLTTLVDVAQAQYVLTRAESDLEIAHNNVWQALLMKAAASGDFSLFDSQLK